ncbi:MAG: Ig-like domain-containing protein, partial [Flammeovirgaceae bacterium]
PKNTASWFVNNKVNNVLVPDRYGYSLPIQILIPVPFNDDLSQSQIFDSGFGLGNWRYTPTNCPNVGGNAGQIYFGTDSCADIPADNGGGFFVTPVLTTSSSKSLELILDQYIDTQSSVSGLIDGSIIYAESINLQKGYSLIGNDACLIKDLNGDYYSQCPKPEWHTSKFTIPQEVIDNGPFRLLFDFRYNQDQARTADTLGWFIDSIKIQEVNLPPVIGINPLKLSTNVNQPLSFNLISKANISDPENDALNITLANPDKGGQIVFDSATQTYIYTPPLDFVGIEKIDYEVVDSKGNITKGSIE